MQVRLDPLGGISGDMFVGALLDAFPQLEAEVLASIDRLTHGRVVCRLVRHRDHVLQGARFVVEEPGPSGARPHAHTSWASIKASIERSGLAGEVKKHAIGIFGLLAEAEGRVHGVDPETVAFHEVGALDSIADIVGAAAIIAALGSVGWSVAPLPLGSGRVRTAHGMMPVPAPATALLLEGFPTIDDGIAGERVTPTGAAILRWLDCAGAGKGGSSILARSGIGFGSKLLPGISNCLRVLVFEEAQGASAHREISVVEFEVDDQSGEDLAIGLDRLRALPAVFDALQMPAFGKKGRMTAHIQVLANPAALETVIAACFRETTTIGLRHRIVSGAALPRRQDLVEVGGCSLRVKSVERPGGRTAKVEADDVAAAEGHATRMRLRQTAERQVLADADEAMAGEAADLLVSTPG